MNLSLRKVLVPLVLALGLVPASASAAVITFASRAAFAAGVSGEIVETWDALADGTVILGLNGISYDPSGGDAIVTTDYLELSSPNGLGSTSALCPDCFLPAETMTFTFSSPISAFGISINTFAGTAGAYTATTNLGDVVGSFFDPFPGAGTGQFVGFTSTLPFTSVVLTPQTGFTYTLDNLNYVVAQAPEPASLLLVGFGASVAAYRRRRKSTTV